MAGMGGTGMGVRFPRLKLAGGKPPRASRYGVDLSPTLSPLRAGLHRLCEERDQT